MRNGRSDRGSGAETASSERFPSDTIGSPGWHKAEKLRCPDSTRAGVFDRPQSRRPESGVACILRMWRGFPISLILLFLLSPLASWLPGVDESSLPMCCRRNGNHHCAASSEANDSGSTHSVAAPSRCPLYSSPLPATLAAFLLPASPAVASPRLERAPSPPTFPPYLIATRTASDRGPPSAC